MKHVARAAMAGFLVGCLVCGIASARPEEREAKEPAGATEDSETAQVDGRAVDAEKSKPEEGTAQPKPVAGYSWKEGNPKRGVSGGSKRFRAPRIDLSKPLATYPGFMMLPDGRSTVWVYVNRAVSVSVERHGRTMVVTLPGVQVGVQNNMNPLVTAHFPTPLLRAHLKRSKLGVQLVLQFRADIRVEHEVLSGPRGMMVFRVILPKLERVAASATGDRATPHAIAARPRSSTARSEPGQ